MMRISTASKRKLRFVETRNNFDCSLKIVYLQTLDEINGLNLKNLLTVVKTENLDLYSVAK